MTKAKRKGCGNKYSKRLAVAGQAEAATINLADDIRTLAGWLRNDILSLAGGNVDTRRQLLDFVIESLRQREHLRPHRIRPVRVMLENQRDLLLAFAQELRTSTAVSVATFSCVVRSETAIWTYSVSFSTTGGSCAVNIPSALIKVPPNYYPAKLIRTGWNCWGLSCRRQIRLWRKMFKRAA